MFADSLLETSWAQRTQRSWTTLTSFGLQTVIIGLLLLIPLLTTVGAPSGRTTVSTPITMGRRDPGPATQPHTARGGHVSLVPIPARLLVPGRMPTRIYRGPDVSETPSGPESGPIGFLGPSTGPAPALPLPLIGTHPVLPSAPPTAGGRTFKTSKILEGSLIRKVEPQYPSLARTARIQGAVVLSAVISKAGTIDELRLVSGHPMLAHAAIEAVSQWRYRPYVLNGELIEVETQITVNFTLGGGN